MKEFIHLNIRVFVNTLGLRKKIDNSRNASIHANRLQSEPIEGIEVNL